MSMSMLMPVSMRPPIVTIRDTPAQLLQETVDTQCLVSRDRGGFDMESKPIRLELDNRDFFDDIGLKSIGTLAGDLVARGKKAVADSTARYCKEGKLLVEGGQAGFREMVRLRTKVDIDTMLDFIPEHGPEMSWADGTLEIDFTPDQLRFNWQIGRVDFTYIPFDVDFNVK